MKVNVFEPSLFLYSGLDFKSVFGMLLHAPLMSQHNLGSSNVQPLPDSNCL